MADKMSYRLHGIIVCLLCLIFSSAGNPRAEEISIIAVGDITIGSGLTSVIEKDDAIGLFAGITNLIKSADIATAPLNTTISDQGEPRYGIEHTFRAPPVIARRLANTGFNVLSLATPHSLDFGVEAVEDTINLLDWYHIKTVGAGVTSDVAEKPALIRVKSAQVAFLAYYSINQFASKLSDPIAYAVYSKMTKAVEAVTQEADLVVVWIHWGKARQTQAVGSRQRFFAQGLIDAGADLVFCQRLHTLQGTELYKGKPIIYSLADFIYETYDKQYSKVVVPKIVFEVGSGVSAGEEVSIHSDSSASRAILKSIELTPIWVDDPNAKYQPHVLSGDDAQEALVNYQKLCAELETQVTIEGERGWIKPNAKDNNE